MKILIVDDDFVCRNLLLEMVKDYGKCNIAINGKEAIFAVKNSIENKTPYNLIFLDIMLEEIDGHEVLKRIRDTESDYNIGGLDGAKIIMTTVLDDFASIKTAFAGQCEGYIVKPVTKEKVDKQLRGLKLIK
ncbi:MAG TPA: response regulator [Spirochaetota bacterium]|nr:response regulator [Spirochaetota bacterium]HPM35510.1 response regulator [Spirochaetota bacterium]